MRPKIMTPTMAAVATIGPTSGSGIGWRLAHPRVRASATTNGWAPRRPEPIDVLAAPPKGSPLSVVLFYRLDEAYSEDGEDDTAFGVGRSPYMGFFIGLCSAPEMLVPEREWVRSLWDALRPHMMGQGA
jgi:hypothetical protein